MNLLERRIIQFKNFDSIDPWVIQQVHSDVDFEYFPRGNDPYLTKLVDEFKEIIIKNVNN